ncbi:peptidase M28 family protein [Bacteroidetes bacterium SCGC AAA795-G10]|nr:peptidase M28 family protein [Bacteroidetes bacterium SCGC AAA795-G10]
MKYKIQICFFILFFNASLSQDRFHEEQISKIYDYALNNAKSYEWLDFLCNQIGGRLAGTLNAERAVQWGKNELNKLGLDRVYLQKVMVPKWVRGSFEYASIITAPGMSINVPVCALGGSIPTPSYGLRAQVVEVKSFDELESLGKEKIKGKFVFFNKAMPKNFIDTFSAYKNTVDIRYQGARKAAKLGAVGVIVRSINLRLDDYPHTGNMSYGDIPNNMRVPAAAISTNGAQLLSSMLSLNDDLYFYLKQDCKNYPEVLSHNIIGEIKGSKFPKDIIVIGGHLDSWDLGDGAHDDGAGIVQSMEVLNIFKQLNYMPKRTIRVVLFTGQKNGLRGGKKYAKIAKQNNEKHLFVLESDVGGFSPRGFSFEADNYQFKNINNWQNYFKPYQTDSFSLIKKESTISPLRGKNTVLSYLKTDSQRYFDYHNAATDVFEAVNKRELELGAASIASLIYLVDQYGL